MRNVTKFDRENGAKFGPKCCEINEIYICYEFSEQYTSAGEIVAKFGREKFGQKIVAKESKRNQYLL